MLKLFASTTLKLFGWHLDIVMPEEKKFVLIGAPHTSNYDFPLALLAFWTVKMNIRWVGKIQMFRGPLHYIFTALGGIPVDRSGPHGFIEQTVKQFEQSAEMVLCLAPEGTRSRTEYWKSGFYHIATEAKLPICLGYIDYQKRRLGFSELIYPENDIKADMQKIAGFYRDIQGKRPENQGEIRVRDN